LTAISRDSPPIEIRGLRKTYVSMTGRRTVAVDGVDLTVPAGGVFGFLGPNGSGKTTTIRCLLGLIRPTAGTWRVLGADSNRGLGEVAHRVGSIVETPAFTPHLSGRRNLELLAAMQGIDRSRVARALDRVDLRGRGNDAFRTYSLGMKQRLGLAAALLKDPDLMILDEPANGLDPAGIVEIRELVRSLGAEGRTVFVSSHLLGEVEQMCDSVAILNHGRCIAAGTVDEVLATGGSARVSVAIDDPDRAERVLREAGMEVERDDSRLLVAGSGPDGSTIARILADHGLYPRELTPRQLDLEGVFLHLTGGDTSG